MVTTPYGMNDPTKPPNREPRKCLVAGCENNSDPGSVTMLCVACCHVVATGDITWYYANYTGKNWISDTVSKISNLKQDKRDLQDEVDELKIEIREAYILENDDVLSLNDLRTFYHENKNLIANAKENETVRTALEKKTSFQTVRLYERYEQIVALAHEKSALTKENEALKKEIGALQERVEFLEKEIGALVYNMDHAYNLGNGKFMTLDDLHNFYTDNKNVHNVVERQRHHITLLELQIKQLQKPKDEDFAAKAKEHSDKKAEAAEQNVKFEAYTSGFWKGFDMGYEKAKDQYYE